MRKLLVKIYLFFRNGPLRGIGLSKVKWIREANFFLEELLRGKRGGTRTIQKFGYTVYLDPRESLAEKMHEYEPESTKVVRGNVKSGDVFVDLGASIGWFTLLAASLGAKVYAFEPNPNSFALLQKNISANKLANVIASDCAISDHNGVETLYVVGDRWFGSRLDDPRNDYERMIANHAEPGEDVSVHETRIDVRTLDSVLIGKVDFIKMDIEEHEDKAFRGMQELLDTNPGLKLLIEHPSDSIRNSLQKRGYSAKELDNLNIFFMKEE